MDIKTCDLQELLSEIERIANSPAEAALKWKEKNGGKIIGIGGLDVPEPLIHAAGMLPVVLLESDDEIVKANSHVEMHQCGYIRSLIEQAMSGKLSYCDVILFHDCCHIVRMLVDVMHTFGEDIPKAQFVYFSPLLEYKTGQQYTLREMQKLRSRLEEISGNKITDEALSESIKLFNRQKKLLSKIYSIRREHPGILTGWETVSIVASGMIMPKEEHILILTRLIELLENEKSKPKSNKVPVVVHGSLCERCGKNILDEIEASGGVIVDDDLYVGSRYFNTLYDEAVPPMEALLNAYIKRTAPCPTRYEERNPGDYLFNMTKNAGASGVIMVVVKFCEAHDYLYFTAHRRLEELKVPEMLIETEYEGNAEGQLKTRLQGFFERLEV